MICNAVLHFAESHAHFKIMFAALCDMLRAGGHLFVRMACDIGLEDGCEPVGDQGVYQLPDGSTRYLLTTDMANRLMALHGLRLLEPLKAVNVQGMRSMAIWVMQKSQH